MLCNVVKVDYGLLSINFEKRKGHMVSIICTFTSNSVDFLKMWFFININVHLIQDKTSERLGLLLTCLNGYNSTNFHRINLFPLN